MKDGYCLYYEKHFILFHFLVIDIPGRERHKSEVRTRTSNKNSAGAKSSGARDCVATCPAIGIYGRTFYQA